MANQPRIAVMMDLGNIYKYHALVFAGIHRYAQEAGWQLILDDWADRMLPTRPRAIPPYEGLIGRITKLGAIRATRLSIPVVNVHLNAPLAAQLPGVFNDHFEGGRLRAEHLLARGFRNFGSLVHGGDRGTVLEGEGFERTVADAGGHMCGTVILQPEKPTRMGIGKPETAEYDHWRQTLRQIDRWMDQWRLPIGITIFDVAITRLVIERCRQRKWSVPEDVAIIAGYNEEVQCALPEPTITSLELPHERIGYEAARMLNELIDTRRSHLRQRSAKTPLTDGPTKVYLPPVGIVARQTTDFHAVDDPLVRQALGYIDTHIHRPILIDDIAEHLNVSRATLTKRFSSKLGRTINKELQRLRIERVKRELSSGDKPIHQIAPAAGFSSVRRLNEMFSRIVGCAPSTYRQRTKIATR